MDTAWGVGSPWAPAGKQGGVTSSSGLSVTRRGLKRPRLCEMSQVSEFR